MRKRLYLDKFKDRLAEDMWGEVFEKTDYFSGLVYYKCKYYYGFIVDDKNFRIDKGLNKKITPITIFEKYVYRKEEFIIERTGLNEEIPEKLQNKYNNERYEERINIYVFEDKYMCILKYYHSSIFRYIYENKLDEKSKKYKSVQGYINSENREIIKDMAMNAPEFVKKKDRKKAKKHLEKILKKQLESIDLSKKTSKEEIEYIKDNIKQKIELLYG